MSGVAYDAARKAKSRLSTIREDLGKSRGGMRAILTACDPDVVTLIDEHAADATDFNTAVDVFKGYAEDMSKALGSACAALDEIIATDPSK